MIIQHLFVKEFRKLKDTTIELGKNITIISGHNATMKSTILGLIMQPFDVQSGSDKQKINKEVFKTIHGDYTQSKFSEHFNLKYPEYDKIGGLQAEIKLYDGFKEEKYAFETILRDRQSNKLRIWKKGDRSEGSGYIKDVPVIYMDLSRLYPLKLSKYEDKVFPELTSEEVRLFNEYYGEIFKACKLKFESIIPLKTKSVRKSSLGFVSEKYDYNALSSGEDSVCNIISAILSIKRIKNRIEADKKEYKGSIVLIDEVDAALHPPIQKNLMDFLYKVSGDEKIQFIVTTHSVDVIEWIYQKQEKALRNKKTSDNLKVVYLVNREESVIAHTNPDLSGLVNNLKLKPGEKIPVFTEDDEARILLEGLLDEKLKAKVDIVALTLSCSHIIPLMLQKKFVQTDGVIACLDGDQKKGIEKQKRAQNIDDVPNLLTLPGESNPEKYIYDFLDNLSVNSDLWESEMESDFYKNIIIQNAPSGKSLEKHNEEGQKWFRKLFNQVIPDKRKFFDILKSEKKEEIEELNNAMKRAIDYVEVNNLTLPSASFGSGRNYQRTGGEFENRVLNNKLIEIVQEMHRFAKIQKSEFDFKHFKNSNEKYRNLDTVEKRLVYQLFKQFFISDCYTFNEGTKKFCKKVE